jgi:hypothetical protein
MKTTASKVGVVRRWLARLVRRFFCDHSWRCFHSEGHVQPDESIKGVDDLTCEKCGRTSVEYWTFNSPNVGHHSRPDGGTKGCSAADVPQVGS